jgi:N6-L-threonylcarbamoyladenine synthase
MRPQPNRPPISLGQLTVLGIETSCDETAAGVVRRHGDGRVEVKSSIVLSQVKDHAPFGGVVPEIAARAHVEAIDAVIKAAMTKAGLGFGDLDGVAATAGPGLVGGVMVGLSAGKAIALARSLPLIAVNHLEGHALSARLAADAPYPYLLLLISGGHCQLLDVEGVGRCARLGSTIDDAAGEAFDKIAKALGLPYPGGPALEKLAAGGDPSRYPLPRMLLGRAGCDFSFSGLKTAAARLAETVTDEPARRDLAAAVQAAIARQLAERSERAMQAYAEAHARRAPSPLVGEGGPRRGSDEGSRGDSAETPPPPLERSETPHPSASPPPSPTRGEGNLRFVVAGGVAANGEVRRVLEGVAAKHGFSFTAPPLDYCTDNAAMIALAGAERLALGLTDGLDAVARPRWPLDEEAALMRPTHIAGRKGAKA